MRRLRFLLSSQLSTIEIRTPREQINPMEGLEPSSGMIMVGGLVEYYVDEKKIEMRNEMWG